MDDARTTVPVKPWSAVTVMVELPEVKSCTVKVTAAEWERELLVPVTVTV